MNLEITDKAVKWLAEKGFDPQFGARPVKRVIQKEVVNKLSKQILNGEIDNKDEIIIDKNESGLIFRKRDAVLN